MLEPLAGRQLLSAAILPFGPGPVIAGGSSTGTLHEIRGIQFSANLGTFFTISRFTNLHATITWGDGTTSTGTIQPMQDASLSPFRFEVDGTHTYHTVGTFNIHIAATGSEAPSKTPVRQIISLDDVVKVSRGNVILSPRRRGSSASPFLLAGLDAVGIRPCEALQVTSEQGG